MNQLTFAQANLLQNELNTALERAFNKFANIFNMQQYKINYLKDGDTILINVLFKEYKKDIPPIQSCTPDSLFRLYNIKGGLDSQNVFGYDCWAEYLLRGVFEDVLAKITRNEFTY